jgi:hypothetical protein
MTPEEFRAYHKETMDIIKNDIRKIKEENGLSPDGPEWVCGGCRKVIQCDNGYLFCECIDERKPETLDNPYSLPIEITEDGKLTIGKK